MPLIFVPTTLNRLPDGGRRPPFHSTSFILHDRGTSYHWEGEGFLSFKSFSGPALYDVGSGRYALDAGSYLILNEGQRYSITIESGELIESFCVFFEPGFAEEVYRSLTASAEHLLDDPTRHPQTRICFFERTYPHDAMISPELARLRTQIARRDYDPNGLVEGMHALMQKLLRARLEIYRQVDSLPALRASTREELYRRIYRARDFLAASLDKPISVRDISQVACLSPNHFLRTFRQVFHASPHEYLTDLRLERAKNLLVNTGCSVTQICFAVGFESLGSFSSLFRRRVGISPQEYRRRKGRLGE